MPDESLEPDKIFTDTFSRRQALALGAGGMAGLAGCSGLTERVSDLQSESDSTRTTTPSPDEDLSVSADFTIDEATVELDIGTYAESDTPFSGVLKLYSSPHLNVEEKTEIGSKSIEQTQRSSSYTITPEYELNYPQRFSISVEISEPTQQSESEIYRTEKVHLPFYNAARDTEMVRVVGRPYPSTKEWNSIDSRPTTAQFWFNAPDESPFDLPAVSEQNYSPDWYEYKDLTVTALVRFVTFDGLYENGDMDSVPYYQWAVVNFSMSEWELLEAFRWNSMSTLLVEGEHRPYSENPSEAQRQYYKDTGERKTFSGGPYANSMIPSNTNNYILDASSAETPYEEYRKIIDNGRNPAGGNHTSSLLFASGRPICKRIADEFEKNLDNPSFNQLNYKEYHKALALKAFIGNWPYGFSNDGQYTDAPEQSILQWFKNANGEVDSVGNCQDATLIFNGIALHLLDTGVANLFMKITGIPHLSAGIINPSLPQGTIDSIGNHPGDYGHNPRMYNTDYGSVAYCEATSAASAMGWDAGTDSGDVEVLSYLMNPSINSHIPVNDNYEPSQSGIVQASTSNPEIPWEYAQNHTTIGNIEKFKLDGY